MTEREDARLKGTVVTIVLVSATVFVLLLFLRTVLYLFLTKPQPPAVQ